MLTPGNLSSETDQGPVEYKQQPLFPELIEVNEESTILAPAAGISAPESPERKPTRDYEKEFALLGRRGPATSDALWQEARENSGKA